MLFFVLTLQNIATRILFCLKNLMKNLFWGVGSEGYPFTMQGERIKSCQTFMWSFHSWHVMALDLHCKKQD